MRIWSIRDLRGLPRVNSRLLASAGRGWVLFHDWRSSQCAFTGGHSLLNGIFQQARKGPHAIFPSDFLSFFVSPAPVTDADLIDSQPSFGNFHCDLRLEAEAIFLDRNGLDRLTPKGFVAGLHITQVDVGEAIGNH